MSAILHIKCPTVAGSILCRTRTSSFSESNIIVLDVLDCRCLQVYVCVCVSNEVFHLVPHVFYRTQIRWLCGGSLPLDPMFDEEGLASSARTLRSLSWTNLNSSFRYFSLTNGRRVSRRLLLVKKSVFMMPSKTRSLVAPLLLIPPHTWTRVGCFGLPFFFDISVFFWNCRLPTFSSWNDVSSVNIVEVVLIS